MLKILKIFPSLSSLRCSSSLPFPDYKLGFYSLVKIIAFSICLNILIFTRKLLIFKIFTFHEFHTHNLKISKKRFFRGLFTLKLCIAHLNMRLCEVNKNRIRLSRKNCQKCFRSNFANL